MYLIDRNKKKIVNFLYDHPGLKTSLSYLKCLLFTLVSAFMFSFGYNAFVNPNFEVLAQLGLNISEISIREMATCGASGVCQSLLLILKFFKI